MKNSTIKIVFTLLMVIGITSCMRYGSEIPSVTDPAFLGKVYNKYCVRINGEDINSSIRFENFVVDEIKGYDCIAASSIKMMPPTRTWTDKMQEDFLKNNKFDGLLVFEKSIIDYEDVVVPAQEIYTTTRTVDSKTKEVADDKDKKKDQTSDSRKDDKNTRKNDSKSKDDKHGKDDKEVKETYTKEKEEIVEKYTKIDSYVERYYNVQLEFTLYDVETGRKAWMASYKVRTKDQDYVPYALISNVVYTLYKQGHIKNEE
jgi:hypothetical protein